MKRVLRTISIFWTLLITEASLNGFDKTSNNFIHSSDITFVPINGTQDFKIIRKNKSWYDGREVTFEQCVRESKCEPLKHKTCLGSKLPYSDTSTHLTYGYNQDQVFEKLQQYTVLKNIPKCWATIQPFLCAIYMPKCEKIDKREVVHLPSLEMCRIVIEPCKLVYNTSFFPEFLRCNSTFLHSKCDNDVREMKFNSSGQCLSPLVHTDISFHFYEGISGCGLPCHDPLYTEDEHNQIRRLILWGASIALGFSVFTIVTFMIDWRSSSKYPALVIFYMHVCYMISSIGWLSQFFFDSQNDIVCSKDGTRRLGEPSAGENLSCVIIFVLVYYFLIAACVWFVIFTYAWYTGFKSLGKIQDRIDKKGAYFHLVAWSLPLILTITTMALGEIDGSSITGICFVGYLNHSMRAGFLLGPILVVLIISGFFLSYGILKLVAVRTSSKDIISVRASSKIRSSIMRGAITAVLVLIFISVTFICHVFEFLNTNNWHESFRLFIVCQLMKMYHGLDPRECVQSSRPSVSMLQLQLLCLFFSEYLMTSWIFTSATIQTWKRYMRTKCGFETEEPVKLQKHKLIAQAFARRKEFHNQGRLSISFHNTHTDPVGLNFELNSIASHDFSSTWANNLPRFVKRRGALTGQNSHSQSSNRRNSQDSQISFSLRHVSVESRRNSLDSQVSVKIAEMKTKVASRRRVKSHKSSKRRLQRSSRIYTRKESTTSVESQIGTHIRRMATSGQNNEQINLFLENSKIILPFFDSNKSSTSDENVSTTSFKVRDSQLNIVLHKKNCNLSADDDDDDDHIDFNSSVNRLAITNFHSDSDDGMINSDNSIKYITAGSDRKSKEPFKEVCGSKSSSKSKSSRKSSRQSARMKNKKCVKNISKKSKTISKFKTDNVLKNKMSSDVLNNDIGNNVKSSLGSSLDSYSIEIGRLGIHSSYSGVSMGKTNSRNSKNSCDVGIQADGHDINMQTVSSQSDLNVRKKLNLLRSQNSHDVKLEYDKKNKNLDYKTRYDKHSVVFYKNDFESNDNGKHMSADQKDCNKYSNNLSHFDDSNEPLLNNKYTSDKPMIVKKRSDRLNVSESKKLKQLLLPST